MPLVTLVEEKAKIHHYQEGMVEGQIWKLETGLTFAYYDKQFLATSTGRPFRDGIWYLQTDNVSGGILTQSLGNDKKKIILEYNKGK